MLSTIRSSSLFQVLLKTIFWLAAIPVSLAFRIIAILFFNWWIPFVARPIDPQSWLFKHTGPVWGPKNETLPSWLKWFDTFDASVDAGWRDLYFTKEGEYGPDNPPKYWKRKWLQIRWLYRNTAYGFHYYVLGCPIKLDQWDILVWGNDGKVQQSLYVDRVEGWWAYDLRGAYGSYKFGWKMLNYITDTGSVDSGVESWGPEYRTLYRLGFNPFNRKEL